MPAKSPTARRAAPRLPKPPIRAGGTNMTRSSRGAIEADRIDLYLQPIVTLPQRKVRYYEAFTRLRTEDGTACSARGFPRCGRGRRPDATDRPLLLFRCVQVVRRLQLKNRDIGLFCNIAAATLQRSAIVPAVLRISWTPTARSRPSLVLEFKQGALRAMGPLETGKPRGAARARLPLLHGPGHRSADGAARSAASAASASSRCRRRCCSARPARRAPTSTPPTFRTCSAGSASA